MEANESLRQQNKALLEQLKSKQSSFNSLLKSMGCKTRLNTEPLTNNLDTDQEYAEGEIRVLDVCKLLYYYLYMCLLIALH